MQQRRTQGLCFNCDEWFQPGHRCKTKQFLLLLDPDDSTLTDVNLCAAITQTESTPLIEPQTAPANTPQDTHTPITDQIDSEPTLFQFSL